MNLTAQLRRRTRRRGHDVVRLSQVRRGRGVALIATATMSIIAAVAATVIITLSIDATRRESAIGERALAKSAAEAARVEFETALAEAPLFYYSYVHELERARICTEDGDQVVEPGSNWPVECGTTWSYQQAAAGGDVRMEITSPNLDDPRLKLRVLASAGRSEYGFDVYYAPDSMARYALYSAGVLTFDGSNVTTLSGEITSGGAMTLPTGELDTPRGLFVAEGGFDTHPDNVPVGAGNVRFYGPDRDDSGEVTVESARELYQVPVNLVGAQAMFAAAGDIACPGTAPKLVGGQANHLCLRTGGDVIDPMGDTHTIDPEAKSYLLIFNASSPQNVSVYTSNVVSAAPATCTGACDLADDSATAVVAGTHPGAINYWTLLTEAALPDDGIIHADRDVHIGLCGEGFVDEVSGGAACTAWGGQPGVTVRRNVTVLAGTLLDPVDVYLSGPIAVDAGVSFGAVASGRILLPYWARVVNGETTVAGSYTGLGLGGSGSSVDTFPTTVAAGPSRFGALNVDGGFAGVDVGTEFQLYDTASITGRGRHWLAPPPLYPAHDGSWHEVQRRIIGGVDVCGELVCSTY